MRKPLEIPPHLIQQAQLYAPGREALDAVCHVLNDYPRLVAETRLLRSRLADFDRETASYDVRLADLQDLARRILEL